jgi:hypothetical protein
MVCCRSCRSFTYVAAVAVTVIVRRVVPREEAVVPVVVEAVVPVVVEAVVPVVVEAVVPVPVVVEVVVPVVVPAVLPPRSCMCGMELNM